MTDALAPRKTQVGGLDFHVAALLCYVPVMMLNYVVPIIFLVAEPKENQPVRFHAAQSLLYTACWIAGIFIGFVGSTMLPILFIVVGAAVGADDLFAMIGLLLQLVFSLLLLLFTFAGLGGFFVLAIMSAMQMDPRIPLLGGIAERFVGPELE